VPRISVIITAHDEAAFLGAAIQSVLDQDLAAAEIVVVNDGSSDGTQSVIDTWTAAYPEVVRAITLSPAHGAPFARNAGARQAVGDLLAFLDGDDVWFRSKLAVQAEVLDRHPDVGYTYGSATELRNGQVSPTPERLGSPTGVYRPPELCVGYLRDTYWNFWPSGLLIRTPVFERSGGFVEVLGPYQHWEDYFYACALAMDESAYVLDEPLTYYRVHDASCSHRAVISKKTIIDERVGLEWFVDRMAALGRGLSPDIVALLDERLERNRQQFAQALPDRPGLHAHANLYAPAAIERLRAASAALRNGAAAG
jgi:glycosyltransferase involved in cell wall biosynthesis